jgi:hypothetical protein
MPVTTEATIAIIAVLVAIIPIGISLFKYLNRRAMRSQNIGGTSKLRTRDCLAYTNIPFFDL